MGNANDAAASQQVQNMGVQPAKPLGQNGDAASANGVHKYLCTPSGLPNRK